MCDAVPQVPTARAETETIEEFTARHAARLAAECPNHYNAGAAPVS